MATNVNEGKSWYRVPVMWLIVAIPAATVIAGILTVYIAAQNQDDMSQEYYKHKLMYLPNSEAQDEHRSNTQ